MEFTPTETTSTTGRACLVGLALLATAALVRYHQGLPHGELGYLFAAGIMGCPSLLWLVYFLSRLTVSVAVRKRERG